jgi:hypothetical protein
LGERNSKWNAKWYVDYIGEIEIDQLDRQNQMKYQVTIVETWPKTINAQEFTLSSNDSYQTVSVDFAYRYWFRSALSPAVHRPPKPAVFVDEFAVGLPPDPASTFEKPPPPPPPPPQPPGPHQSDADAAMIASQTKSDRGGVDRTGGRPSEIVSRIYF